MQYFKKTHFIALFAAIIIAGLFLLGIFHFRRSLTAAEESGGTITGYTVSWDGSVYQGMYEGEIEDSKPEGSGTFTGSDGVFSYEGSWHNGLIDGNGTIHFSGELWIEGEFRRGKRNGWCREYTDGSSYKEALYGMDIPYGNVCTYEDNKLVSAQLLVNCVPVETIMETAAELDPEIVSNDLQENGYVWIEGTVDTVFETDAREYFLLQNERLGLVLGSHDNREGAGSGQTFLPNLRKGDVVRIYGYYGGLTENTVSKKMKGYGYDFPVIYPFYGELVSEDAAAELYASLQRHPYLYYGRAAEGTFVVRKCLKKGSTYYIWAEEKAGSGAEYVLVYHNEGREDLVFIVGKEISFSGWYNGQHKENIAGQNETDLFVMYPEIYICSLK